MRKVLPFAPFAVTTHQYFNFYKIAFRQNYPISNASDVPEDYYKIMQLEKKHSVKMSVGKNMQLIKKNASQQRVMRLRKLYVMLKLMKMTENIKR